MYCGNNALNPQVTSGQVALGTRYSCMRKGIGRGMNLPYDPNYLAPYTPIDNTKIYCGNDLLLPDGYDRFGSLPECLQKGVGIGKRERALKGPGVRVFKIYILPTLIYLAISAGVFCWLYFGKPNLVTKKDENGNRHIDWSGFAAFYVVFLLALAVVILVVWNFYI